MMITTSWSSSSSSWLLLLCITSPPSSITSNSVPLWLLLLLLHSLYYLGVLAYKMVQSLAASSRQCTAAFVHTGTTLKIQNHLQNKRYMLQLTKIMAFYIFAH
jgi:hypothetical protein